MLTGPLCCIQSREEMEDVCMQARVFRAVRKARREITSKYEVMKYLFVEEMKLIFTRNDFYLPNYETEDFRY